MVLWSRVFLTSIWLCCPYKWSRYFDTFFFSCTQLMWLHFHLFLAPISYYFTWVKWYCSICWLLLLKHFYYFITNLFAATVPTVLWRLRSVSSLPCQDTCLLPNGGNPYYFDYCCNHSWLLHPSNIASVGWKKAQSSQLSLWNINWPETEVPWSFARTLAMWLNFGHSIWNIGQIWPHAYQYWR